MTTELLVYYLVAVNVVTFIVYGLDKWKARRGRWRIPEAALLWLAVLGGQSGGFVGDVAVPTQDKA